MAEKGRKSARRLPHYWTPAQVGQIIAAIDPGPHKLFALTLWRTGLRCAEALALEWRDIRLGDEPMVTVRKGKGGRPGRCRYTPNSIERWSWSGAGGPPSGSSASRSGLPTGW